MAVLKKDKNLSEMEFFKIASRIQASVYHMCLRDFGLRPFPFHYYEKSDIKINSGVIDKKGNMIKIPVIETAHVGYGVIPEWAFAEARVKFIAATDKIMEGVLVANAIYPVGMEELAERRRYQTQALAYCTVLNHHIAFYSKQFKFNLEPWKNIIEDIDQLNKLIRGWKKSDNRFNMQIIKNHSDKLLHLRRQFVKGFMRKFNSFRDMNDLTYMFDTGEPNEMLQRSYDVINEIVFGVTPQIKQLLIEKKIKDPHTPIKLPPQPKGNVPLPDTFQTMEKYTDKGKDPFLYMNSDDFSKVTAPLKNDKRPMPEIPPIQLPHGDPLKMELVKNEPIGNGEYITYYRHPDGDEFVTDRRVWYSYGVKKNRKQLSEEEKAEKHCIYSKQREELLAKAEKRLNEKGELTPFVNSTLENADRAIKILEQRIAKNPPKPEPNIKSDIVDKNEDKIQKAS
jgi:hypothetical protein